MPLKLSESVQTTLLAIDTELAAVSTLMVVEGFAPSVTEQQVKDWLDRVARKLQKVNQALGRENPQFFDPEKVKQVIPTGFPDTARTLLAYIFGGACSVLQSLKKADFNAATQAIVDWLPSLKEEAAEIASLKGMDDGLPDPGFLGNYLMQLFIESTKDSKDFNVGQGATKTFGKGDGSSVIVAGMVYFSVAAKILVQGDSFGQKGGTDLKKLMIDDVENPAGVRRALLEIYGKNCPLVKLPLKMKLRGLDVFGWSGGLWKSNEGGGRNCGKRFHQSGWVSARGCHPGF